MSIDLHCHSIFSDGILTVEELLTHAKKRGLKALSITDHDCIDGVETAKDFAAQINLEYVPGIEFSCKWENGDLHALGYFIDHKNELLKSTIELCKNLRDARNPKILKKLNELNINLSLNEVNTEAKSGVVGRPHIARCLVKKGYVKDIKEAFSFYLSKGKPAYIEKEKISAEEAVNAIKKSSGIPFIAHPVTLDDNINNLEKHLILLKSVGFEGIEAIHPDLNKELSDYLIKFANRHNMLISGGSDFHSFSDIGSDLGCVFVPYDYLRLIKEKL
jgi:hypothetical protein